MTGQAGPGAATPSGKVTARDSKTATPAMLQTMGLAYIHAWLTEDYWTIAQITLALEDSGASWQQVAESFSLAAASLLTDVFGGSSTLAAVAAIGKARGDAARQARWALRDAELSRLHIQPGVGVVSWRGGRFRSWFRSCCPFSLGLTLYVVVVPGLQFGPVGLDLLGPRGQLVQLGVQRGDPLGLLVWRSAWIRVWFLVRLDVGLDGGFLLDVHGSVLELDVGFLLGTGVCFILGAWLPRRPRFIVRVLGRPGRLRVPRRGRFGSPGIAQRSCLRILDSS
jgi:hypothetical protein